MTFNPDIHHRRSIRLREYDYSSVGAYFVTVCANGRECLFGECDDGDMRVNDAGRMVVEIWNSLLERFPNVALDEYMIMPNHFHGIIVLEDANERRGEPCVRPVLDDPIENGCRAGDHNDRPCGTHVGSVSRIVQAFKSLTTVKYVRGVNDRNWSQFSGRLWQRNFYERIIRDEKEMSSIREYIRFNPSKWTLDKENPHVVP